MLGPQVPAGTEPPEPLLVADVTPSPWEGVHLFVTVGALSDNLSLPKVLPEGRRMARGVSGCIAARHSLGSSQLPCDGGEPLGPRLRGDFPTIRPWLGHCSPCHFVTAFSLLGLDVATRTLSGSMGHN